MADSKGAADGPQVPVVRVVPDAPGMPGMPGMPEVHEVPEVRDVPEAPGAPVVRAVRAAPDGPAASAVFDDPATAGEAEEDDPGVDLFRARTPAGEAHWFDDEAGPVVRLYSMTRGRTRPVEDGLFDLISLITAVEPGPAAGAVPAHVLDPEHQTILAWCRREPLSVAELGSYTDLPVSVVRVLLGDLYDADLISVTRPVPLAELPDERLLRDVINGLRAL